MGRSTASAPELRHSRLRRSSVQVVSSGAPVFRAQLFPQVISGVRVVIRIDLDVACSPVAPRAMHRVRIGKRHQRWQLAIGCAGRSASCPAGSAADHQRRDSWHAVHESLRGRPGAPEQLASRAHEHQCDRQGRCAHRLSRQSAPWRTGGDAPDRAVERGVGAVLRFDRCLGPVGLGPWGRCNLRCVRTLIVWRARHSRANRPERTLQT